MFGSKLLWCEIAQRFMGSLFIVFLRPCVHDSANLAQPTENMEFDISSSRKVRLNRSTYEFCADLPGWMNSSFNPALFRPSGRLCRDKFRAVIHAHFCGVSSPCGYAVRHTNDAGRRQVGIHFRGRRFPTEVVKRIERAKTPAARQRIAHEVHRPARVDGGLRLLTDGRSPFLFATHVQPRLSINPVDAFVVSCMPLTTRHGKAFGKSASWMAVRQPRKRRYDKAAVTRRRLAGKHASTHV